MKTQCECKKAWQFWFTVPFGTTYIILCKHCGRNATERAEVTLGIDSKFDTLEMAQHHLDLLQYEKGYKNT